MVSGWLILGGIYVAYRLVQDQANRQKARKNVERGYAAEWRVARYLRQCGATVEMSPGSRGAADVTAAWSSLLSTDKWLVQVKASKNGTPQFPGKQETERLIRKGKKERAKPVVALSAMKSKRWHTQYFDARNRERLYPSK